ncbi:MAG: helix-turn-helix domain-containing protein, partial [Candidatus Saccharicenans sp.]|nr:helix-turn-helix domain-containing protein [Candidatus Saccharicenans sp.]
LNRHLDDIAKRYIVRALEKSGGRMKKAAPMLGVSYRTLRYLIDKYELKARIKEEEANQVAPGSDER